ncbi:Uncharacterised protein [Mycobacterium tuberculosis]|nr:Uncharacterised protein [Mycobacterium tuberculosis]
MLVILFSNLVRDKFHSANWTISRMILYNFWMHRTGIFNLERSIWNFFQIHPTDRARSRFVINLIAFTHHRTIILASIIFILNRFMMCMFLVRRGIEIYLFNWAQMHITYWASTWLIINLILSFTEHGTDVLSTFRNFFLVFVMRFNFG